MLDHARDFLYFGSVSEGIDPFDPNKSHWGLYVTRWVTHLCAPTFVFLAGVSISIQKDNDKKGLPFFLFTRGLWLLFLEITLINFAWTFLPPFQVVFIQVIGAIGLSMMGMSLLILFPRMVAGIAGIGYLLVQHFLIGTFSAVEIDYPWFEVLTFRGGMVKGLTFDFFVPYPFLPWLAIMSLGFALGSFFSNSPNRKSGKSIAIYGLAGLGLFGGLRIWNVYGDRFPWSATPFTRNFWFEFWDVSKYPPSLQYILATLGISAILFWCLDRWATGTLKKMLLTFGRVPMFFYVLHLFTVHLVAVGLFLIEGMPLSDLGKADTPFGIPSGYGYGLPMLYVIWLVLIVVTYFPCRWFENVKAKNKGQWWVSYT